MFQIHRANELPAKYRAWLREYGVTEDMPLDKVYELAVRVRLRRLASGAPGVKCKTQGLRRQTDIEVLSDLVGLLRPLYAALEPRRHLKQMAASNLSAG